MNKTSATNFAKIKINGIEWYVAQYTPSMEQKKIISKQISSKIATELPYVDRSIFMKKVPTQKFRTFELGTQEILNVLTRTIAEFQQIDTKDSQHLNDDIFNRPPVTGAQCIIGTQK